MRPYQTPSTHDSLSENEAMMSECVDLMTLRGYESVQASDEPDLVVELIDIYLEVTGEQLATIDEAIHDQDRELLLKIAHSLKGSSGSIGATRMSSFSSSLELLETQDFFGEAQRLSQSLREEFGCVAEVLKAERQRRLL
jgi:HPt (histidine-containing phosphotransfer) domain-containing protein